MSQAVLLVARLGTAAGLLRKQDASLAVCRKLQSHTFDGEQFGTWKEAGYTFVWCQWLSLGGTLCLLLSSPHSTLLQVVIFGAGTGNPYFTTDTAAALRAAEIEADAFFKATKVSSCLPCATPPTPASDACLRLQVDGVYDSDPAKNAEAKLHKRLSYREVMESGLQVMDETAITLCKENNIPVIVFNLFHPGNIMRALTGDKDVGTLVTVEEEDPAEGMKA